MFGRGDERGYDVANGWETRPATFRSENSVFFDLVFDEYWGADYELLEVRGDGGQCLQRALVECRCIIRIASRI